jgi:high-affinity iron transporter
MSHRIRVVALALLVLTLTPALVGASGPPPAQAGEQIRTDLTQAQLSLAHDVATARKQLAEAQTTYASALDTPLSTAAPETAARARDGFAAAGQALDAGDALAFAAARSQIWTSLLDGGYRAVERALLSGDAATAQAWLPLREFRRATRFTRIDADATLAVDGFAAGRVAAADVLLAMRADLLDTYQARLTEALHDMTAADRQGFTMRRAEAAALAQGYFAILASAYREQRGATALAEAERAFEGLQAAALRGERLPNALAQADVMLRGFRAVPLSPNEQIRRAGQLLRFLSLVPVEYQRGVSGGVVTRDLEIREAITFRDGAAAAFADLQATLDARDSVRTAQIAQRFAALEQQLDTASVHAEVAEPDAIQASADQIVALLREAMPPEWQRHDTTGDFDVIGTALDQMEAAVTAGQYDLAESARLEAYAILESGPEARLVVFAPQFKASLEDLFWYGQGQHAGLARLIDQRAPAATIKASRAALDAQLAAAQQALSTSNAPIAVASNAAIIVFREGLEAVLILASLMGSLKLGEQRAYRRPLWWGAAVAFGATVLTWLLTREVLTWLARYGERLEAIVSLIAIGVLLLITNWFFHKVYWTGWIANFHSRKRRIIGGAVGQWIGLATLGFTSIYREGFETVLFLQALVLEAGATVVLGGIALGLTGTLLVGVFVFALQAKLPYKKMLIVTGVLIGGVLLTMVGNTVHVLQVIGWMPIHPIGQLTLPYWTGLWLGLFATWEGILLQVAAAAFVIGSYMLAEWLQERRGRAVAARAPAGVEPATEYARTTRRV